MSSARLATRWANWICARSTFIQSFDRYPRAGHVMPAVQSAPAIRQTARRDEALLVHPRRMTPVGERNPVDQTARDEASTSAQSAIKTRFIVRDDKASEAINAARQGSELRGSFVSSACQKACSISSVPSASDGTCRVN